MLMSWSVLQKGCSSSGLDIGDSPSVLWSSVTVSREQKQKAGKVERKREREQRCAGSGSARTILSETSLCASPARRRRSAFFPPTLNPGQTRLCYLLSLALWAPVASLKPRGQHQLVSSYQQPPPGLAPATGHQVPVPAVFEKSGSQLIAGLFSQFYSIQILTHVGLTMVIENSIRTRLSEIVNLNLFKSSENNNVRKSSQSKHNQKLVANPSEETFVSNQSTAKLLKVINIIINWKTTYIFYFL